MARRSGNDFSIYKYKLFYLNDQFYLNLSNIFLTNKIYPFKITHLNYWKIKKYYLKITAVDDLTFFYYLNCDHLAAASGNHSNAWLAVTLTTLNNRDKKHG